MAAIGVANLGRLGIQIECLDARAEHHMSGLAIEGLVVADLLGGAAAGEWSFQLLEQIQSALETRSGHGSR